jgi:hypothetical protein
MSAPIDDGPPLIPGIDFTLGRPEPIDLRLAFNTLSDEEFDAAGPMNAKGAEDFYGALRSMVAAQARFDADPEGWVQRRLGRKT